MARQVGSVTRNKRTYDMSQSEFKSGKWLTWIENSDKIEIEYRNNYLIIKDMVAMKTTDVKSEMKENDGE